jgi:sugar lactone lactonase YvrE
VTSGRQRARIGPGLILAGIVILAFMLRSWAALRLPLDYDEPVYLEAAQAYAQALRSGDLHALIDYDGNREHPALGKILYAFALLGVGQDADWMVVVYVLRFLSVLFGVLAATLLALFDPLAGGLLAVHTLAVKYTAQIYLEALPHLASIAAVLALVRSSGGRDRWFWISALALGVAAAGKFTYLPIVLVLAYLAIWEKRLRWRNLILYGLVAVATFWLLNPTLWREPFSRLFDSLFFHMRYSQGPRVELAGYPWHRPLYWISRAEATVWHPDVFFYPALDGPIFLLALPGLYWEWRERRWVVVWTVTSLLLLLLWPTKWPQYTLVLTPALCLSASSAVRHIYHSLREQDLAVAWFQAIVPRPPLAFWVLVGALGIVVAVIYTVATLQLTLGRLGWSDFTKENSQLPSSIVYSLAAGSDLDPEGGMILGTERGGAIWLPPVTTDLPDRWRVFTTGNSGLPDNRVRAVTRDQEGDLWFGTMAGLARYDGRAWQTYPAVDLGLPTGEIYALATGSDGRVWVGARSGAAVFDGQHWTPFTTMNSGLVDAWVLSLAIEPQPEGDRVWFGTGAGVSQLDTASGTWASFTEGLEEGVAALLLDSEGRLWAGTLGDGLGLWNGTAWQFYTTGNSQIPYSTVTALAEVEPGVLWVGTAAPAETGGMVSEFDGQQWKDFNRRNSGYSEAEPLVIAQDAAGRWWIGTRTVGVEIYHRSH